MKKKFYSHFDITFTSLVAFSKYYEFLLSWGFKTALTQETIYSLKQIIEAKI